MMATEQVAPPRISVTEARDRIATAAAARDDGMTLAEMAEDARGGWSRSLIDQAIAWYAQTGQPFSANDFRDLLPPDLPVRGLMGSRFGVAQKIGLIRPVGGETSTKGNTHAKGICRWVGVTDPAVEKAETDRVMAELDDRLAAESLIDVTGGIREDAMPIDFPPF